MSNKTRHSQRQKKINQNLRQVDSDTRKYVLNSRIDELESDFYDSPNRLAEDSDNEDFELGIEGDSKASSDKKKKQKKLKKKINKRMKKETHLRKNFNLKKLIKEDDLDNKKEYTNFVNIRMNSNKYPTRSFCSICGSLSRYTCPRCGEKYCGIRCHDLHKEVFCLKFEMM
ncbi:hypothetical protein ABPG73_002294 [Tetrahymena malaccensis]